MDLRAAQANISNRTIRTRVLGVLAGCVLACALVLVFCPLRAQAQLLTYEADGEGVSDNVTKLIVSKRDNRSFEFVKGATLAIIEKDTGKVEITWKTTNESKTFERILNGKDDTLNVNTEYILREVVTPKGYETAQDTVFYIDDYGSIHLVDGEDAEVVGGAEIIVYDDRLATEKVLYKNAPMKSLPETGNDTPEKSAKSLIQTGDATPFALIVQIALLALIVALASAVHLKRVRAK